MSEAQKMELTSMDVAAQKREELKLALGGAFPEVFAEGSIDFDQLKRVLGEWVGPSKERFGLNWSGKAECMKVIQQPSVATLKPVREDSVDFDETENLFIEGDNLEVLKLLQKAYFGKIKMIYIDPPYNKGKEFIYPDKYAETLETYLAYSGQSDLDGRRFATNTDTSGRYHSNWLRMMYPRLYVAKTLLRDDGCIFISIDDNEQANIRELCNQVFGEENFIAVLPTIMNLKGNPDTLGFSATHEYTIVYARNRDQCELGKYDLDESDLDDWLEDEHGIYKRADTLRRTGQDASREKRPKGFFPIFIREDGFVYVTDDDAPLSKADTTVLPVNDEGDELSWTWGKQKIKDEPHNLLVVEGRSGKNVYKKQRPQLGELPTKKPKSIFYKPEYSTSSATTELKNLLGKKVFEGPKPVPLLMDFVKIGCPDEGIVLDFFAGSGSLAHAVYQQNSEDGGKRSFVCVQLPEPCDGDSDAAKAGYRNIAELCRDRIKKADQRINKATSQLGLDNRNPRFVGFKSFKLTNSNFKIWKSDADNFSDNGEQLDLHVDHVVTASSPSDILYELLLKSGFPLTTNVEQLEVAEKSVFSVHDGAMLICLEKDITSELIDGLAEANPLQVICLDEGFKGNDQLKTNAVQTFKARAQAEESEIVFRTV